MTLGFLLAFSNEDGFSPLFAMFVVVAFLLLNIVRPPFVKGYHNYRACYCHFTQFMILFVVMYYRRIQ
jgi:type II secretory pathway component PulF